ncbi:MAG: hypothetical protein JWM88_1696 [Verrucomicrobia bacterium]|nr:hypothetical protein [Verrucomicrobiota bacterium]
MFRIISRTPEQKADLEWTWERCDEDFFAAGACHILAGTFLEMHPAAGHHALMLQPAEGFRGGHVVATDGTTVFDCRGWSPLAVFLHRYTEGCRAIYPGWNCTLVKVAAPLSWAFARETNCRHASQFFRDPIPRAQAFIRGFPPPAPSGPE